MILKAISVEISKAENRILVDDKDKGQVWISLHRNGKITNYEVGQEVVVWIDGGVDDSSPMQAGALNSEITSP
ncbi:MAG: YobA family protein [Bacillaceae bacterium]|nr:YobA family protein [Bacillaceae bacterium]